MALSAGLRGARAASRANKALQFMGQCKTCGKSIKASQHQNFPWVCKGCGEVFCKKHGVYFACSDCLGLLPPDEASRLESALKGGMVAYSITMAISLVLGLIFAISYIFPPFAYVLFMIFGTAVTGYLMIVAIPGFFVFLIIAMGIIVSTRNKATKVLQQANATAQASQTMSSQSLAQTLASQFLSSQGQASQPPAQEQEEEIALWQPEPRTCDNCGNAMVGNTCDHCGAKVCLSCNVMDPDPASVFCGNCGARFS